VFDTSAEDGFSCVIRIARLERYQEFERAIKWHEITERVAVRLPKIYEIGQIDGHHYVVYKRLLGYDLEKIYSSLSIQENKRVAEEVAEIQQKISLLDRRFFERIFPWYEVVQRIISRSE
jgi:hypothetical protein